MQSTGDKIPFVSVIIPCRNEEKFIGNCLDSVIKQDYPREKLEVLVMDGMSEDGTGMAIKEYSSKYPFIKRLENRQKITPSALNKGIKHANGEIIIRMDSHAVYQKDYISKCVAYLDEYKADNVGGAMITLPRENTFIGKAIISALSSPFGVGNSTFRTGSNEPKWVDTVFGGCYRKEVFEKIGFFNEKLVFSQDMEFNRRLTKAGGKILFHPDIVSYYYARSDFKSFCRHNFNNGVWAIYPLKFVKGLPVSLRHLVPLIFVSSLLLSAALSSFLKIFLWLFLFILGVYLATNIYFSFKISKKESDFRYLIVMPVMFTVLHFAYGMGSLWGALKLLRRTG